MAALGLVWGLVAERYGVSAGHLAAAVSALVAGALMTLMTWLVAGAESTGIRILVAWVVGALIVLGTLNHAIVSTIELFFGIRFGAEVTYGELLANLGVSAAGNFVGGLVFVTLTRFGQAAAATGR